MRADWKFEQIWQAPSVESNLCGGVPITEGPVWDGQYLFFTHIQGSRIMRHDHRTKETVEWTGGTDRTNGLAFGKDGTLYGCSSGSRCLLRFDAAGKGTPIATRLDGKRLNTPNDLAVDARGRIWFTNPWNADNVDADPPQELIDQSVLRADPQADGTYTVTRATYDTTMPNGILVSRDERTLYVAESGYASDVMRELRAYPISEDATLGAYETLFTWGEDHRGPQRGIDGMCLDTEGNIYCVAGWRRNGPGPMIYVISPGGRVLATHPAPVAHPTNCCFGGPHMNLFFLTTLDGGLYRATTEHRGWALFPSKAPA